MLKILIALAVMGGVVGLAAGSSAEWLAASAAERALRLGGIVLLGALVYFSCLWLLGFRLRDFSRQSAN